MQIYQLSHSILRERQRGRSRHSLCVVYLINYTDFVRSACFFCIEVFTNDYLGVMIQDTLQSLKSEHWLCGASLSTSQLDTNVEMLTEKATNPRHFNIDVKQQLYKVLRSVHCLSKVSKCNNTRCHIVKYCLWCNWVLQNSSRFVNSMYTCTWIFKC